MRIKKLLASIACLLAAPLTNAQGVDEDALIEKMRSSMAQQGQTLSADQELSMRLKIRQVQQGMQGLGGGGPARQPVPRPATAAPTSVSPTTGVRSTADLARQIAALPAPQPVQTEMRRDGFTINAI